MQISDFVKLNQTQLDTMQSLHHAQGYDRENVCRIQVYEKIKSKNSFPDIAKDMGISIVS